MYITCKGLTYAKVTGGGAGSAVTYSNGAIAENLIAKATINFQNAEGQDYADGIRIAHKKKITGVNTSFELADLTSAIKKALLGWQTATSDLIIDESDPDYYGIGFYVWNEAPVSETDQWICYWIYKSRFSLDSIDVSTATDSISYQHQTINGTGVGVQLSSGGKQSFVITNDEPLATEAAAVAWLKSKANITG
jgi:phi13 family phage major tail protein